MIYSSFTNVIKTRSYRKFCTALDIPFGPGAEKLRTPAESRVAHQFLLAVNAGRGGIFLNFNSNVAVVVDKRLPSWFLSPYRFNSGLDIGKHARMDLGSWSDPLSVEAFNSIFRK